jgi:hypothetical protein
LRNQLTDLLLSGMTGAGVLGGLPGEVARAPRRRLSIGEAEVQDFPVEDRLIS